MCTYIVGFKSGSRSGSGSIYIVVVVVAAAVAAAAAVVVSSSSNITSSRRSPRSMVVKALTPPPGNGPGGPYHWGGGDWETGSRAHIYTYTTVSLQCHYSVTTVSLQYILIHVNYIVDPQNVALSSALVAPKAVSKTCAAMLRICP